MPGPAPSFRTAAIVVAAGQGLRAGQAGPTQFAPWRGKPVVRHSAEALAAAGLAPIVVVIPEGATEIALAALADIAGIRLVTGGRRARKLRAPTASELPMTTVRSPFLRTVLAVDAALSGLSGAVLALDARMLAGPLGLSPDLMRPVGIFLIGYAALLAWLAARPALPRKAVWALVALNVVWAVESVMLLALRWAEPTGLGLGLVLAQAAAVLLVADLYYLALRRSRAAA